MEIGKVKKANVVFFFGGIKMIQNLIIHRLPRDTRGPVDEFALWCRLYLHVLTFFSIAHI